MKAAIYCRLSKEDDEREKERAESESIRNQRVILMDYARANGYEVYRVYCDEDYSGVDRNRPGFNALIEDARRHKFDVILAKTQSRFTRDMELVEKYLHGKFAEWGIRFIAVVDHVDTADPGNKKSRQIAGLVNEWYLEDLSNNVRAVLDHKRREGKYIAAFPLYGYRKDPQDHNHLVVDPEAARVVRCIFALYRQGNGVTRIARILNEAQVPSPTAYRLQKSGTSVKTMQNPNGELWSKATVYQMLGNRTYTGNLEQGRHKRVSYKSQKTVWLPRDQWIVVPHTHEAIIPLPVFEEVQRMRHLKARGGGTGKIRPLSGLVICGCCGSRMEQTGSGGGKTGDGSCRYYRCRLAMRDRTRCPGQKYMPVPVLEKLVQEHVWAHIEELLQPDTWGESMAVEVWQVRCNRQRQEMERIQHQKARRCKAMHDLYLDKSDGNLSQVQFEEMNRAFLQEIEMLEQKETAIRTMLESTKTEEAQRLWQEALAVALDRKQLDRRLACLLIRQVVVFPPQAGDLVRKIEIRWRF